MTLIGLIAYIAVFGLSFFIKKPKNILALASITITKWVAIFLGWGAGLYTAFQYRDWVIIPAVGFVLTDIFILFCNPRKGNLDVSVYRVLILAKLAMVVVTLVRHVLA